MKKLTLLTCAFMASTMAFAQTNLALNKTAKASSVSIENNGGYTADKAIDGDTGTKWASQYQDKEGTSDENKLTDEQRDAQWFYVDLGSTQKINTIKMSVDNQPAANFDIRIANEISTEDPTSSGTAVLTAQSSEGNNYNTYKFDDVEGRYVIIDFNKRATGWGYGINELEVYNIDYNQMILASFTIPSFVIYNAEGVTVPASLLNTNNEAFTGDITFTATKDATVTLENGQLTINANASGTYVITAKAGEVELKRTIYLLADDDAPAAPAEEEIVTPVYSNTDTKYNSSVIWTGIWNEQAETNMAEVTLNGQIMKPIGAAGCLIIGNTVENLFNGATIGYKPSSETGTTFHIELFTARNTTGSISFEQSNLEETKIATEAGKWASFDIDVANATNLHTITLKLDKIDGIYPNVLVANVYFSNKEVTPAIPAISEQPDSNGVYKLTGMANNAEQVNSLLTDKNKTAYDLRELTIDESINSFEVANPNAMIVVTEDQATRLNGMKNLCTTDNTYFFSVKQYELTDGYPVYTTKFISTKGFGYKYTRNFDATKYVTTYLPTATTVPEGITAYTFDNVSEADGTATYTFKKVENGQLAAQTPYILYVTKDTELTASISGNEGDNIDLNLAEDHENSTDLGETGVTFHGTYQTLTGNGTQYALYDNTDTESIVLKKVDGGTIGAFRGYFTISGTSSDAKNIRFAFNDNTTGISAIATENIKNDGVYSIDGRFINANGSVKNLAKGLYIVNGKKVIVK